MEFTDRYKALGIPYPNPETMCKGRCEGTGYYPAKGTPKRWRLKLLCSMFRHLEWWYWKACLRDLFHEHDGWQFVKCETCGGSGLRK